MYINIHTHMYTNTHIEGVREREGEQRADRESLLA